MKIQQFIHRPEQRRLKLMVNDKVSFISYVDRTGIFYLTYSEVPHEMRGMGIGEILVSSTLEYLQEQGIQFIPVCSYIKRKVDYLANHELHLLNSPNK